MFLSRVSVTNFRTISDGGLELNLTSGLNVIAGPNNCGKGNVLRALRLALDPHARFDPAVDGDLSDSSRLPSVTCSFEATEPDKNRDLLSALAQFRNSVTGPESGFRALNFNVTYTPQGRHESLVDRDGMRLKGDRGLHSEVIAEFRRAIRLVLVPAGASIDDVLRPLLRELVAAKDRTDVDDAAATRAKQQAYAEAVRGAYLADLEDELDHVISRVFPNADHVVVDPRVPGAEAVVVDSLMDVRDRMGYSLVETGTGLRIAATVGCVHHLADRAERCYVVALEEPEAYLHPGAQERLREQIERTAARDDVTVVTTTESPFLVSTTEESKVFTLGRDNRGVTGLDREARGFERPRASVGDLLGDARLAEVLDRSARIGSADGVLIVEGWTDSQYLQMAAERFDRADELARLQVIVAEGAKEAALEAIVVRAQTDAPIVVLLDDDDIGVSAKNTLVDRFGFDRSEQVMLYSDVIGSGPHAIEAEDLFGDELISLFVEELGEDMTIEGKRKRKSGGWRYDFTQDAKSRLPNWLKGHADASHLEAWEKVLDHVSERFRLQRDRAEKKQRWLEENT